MAENSNISPLFAGRYRFEPVDENWETGRTGFTHLAHDTVENRTVVIKRADVTSPQSRQHEHSLQNEAKALEKLNGLGVPELYEVNQAVYGNQKFTYLIMEFLDTIRVEREISSLTPLERARILLELFRLLAKAHYRGIANGDVDLKHLFWSKEKKQLTVIDWGNSSITYPQKNHHLSFDVARSAEIIYALIVQDGAIPVTGSLALPEKENLLASLLPLPEEFYKLCTWAPRNPSEDVQIPLSALDMFAVTQKWISSLDPGERYSDAELEELIMAQHHKTNSHWSKIVLSSAGIIIVLLVAVISFFSIQMMGNSPDLLVTSTLENFQETATPVTKSTLSPTPSNTNTIAPTETGTTAQIPTPTTTLRPPQYSKIVGFDSNLPLNFKPTPCWITSSTSGNFGKRLFDDQWQFQVDNNHKSNDPIKSDFNECFDGKQASAIGLNFWIQRLAINSEFGIYIEGYDGSAREYVFRTEVTDNTTHLMVREDDGSFIDYIQLRIRPKLIGDFPSQYYQYSVKLVLALNDQGKDIIYFSPGSDLQPLTTEELNIDPEQMKRVDVRPSLGDVQSIGLIGNGPDMQILIWPLVFYEDIAN